jgi:exosortase C (VPDSG-CTERM-specific)
LPLQDASIGYVFPASEITNERLQHRPSQLTGRRLKNDLKDMAQKWPSYFALSCAALVLCFCRPLVDLARFGFASEMYSHIILVPFISIFLLWVKRNALPPPSEPDRAWTVFFMAAGLCFQWAYWFPGVFGAGWSRLDSLILATLSFLSMFAGLCAWFLGRRLLRAIVFPLCFLLLMVPLPLGLSNALESLLQHASAAVAYVFFEISGTPIYAIGELDFKLPGITIAVAPECSGIHSSLALFVTSLLAGFIFLRSAWARAVLCLAVIPLGIIRNAFRIFTIGELCVRFGPQMINSYVHRTGGWIFFLVSLGPFFILLYLLARSERPKAGASINSTGV